MNTVPLTARPLARSLLATAIAAIVVAGCVATPTAPLGALEVRRKLTELTADPQLGTRAPAALQEAAAAVRVAEEGIVDEPVLGEHRVYVADRRIEIARARAETRYAEDQRRTLGEERDRDRLAARTREADAAQDAAVVARADASAARDDAAATSQRAAAESAELQRQIDALQLEATERGLILTLGDVLFTTGQSNLRGNTSEALDKLVTFLKQYETRTVEIEGHTDNVGSDSSNQALSERRANAVRTYLVRAGIANTRLTVAGLGETQPIGSNESEAGRQENRRVVLVISNPEPTARPVAAEAITLQPMQPTPPAARRP